MKENTTRGYLKELNGLNPQYLRILKEILILKGITISTPLTSFLEFPFYINDQKLKESLASKSSLDLYESINKSNYFKTVSGRNLGTFDLEVNLPK